MPTIVSHPYITSRKDIGQGHPIIAGTRTRVSNIIAYYKLGFSPEELAREFPHLTLSQIHDALSYYYEHQEKIDKEIEEDSEEYVKKLVQK
ncbi:MAG: hypothetical protein CVV37_07950 [Nitrospira bacterium HGW-Nitrospira-1]|nr:MAG: hypothetical protein CVV37_07950 [Nitrospira bacterium HGW-Nitrospira-1]